MAKVMNVVIMILSLLFIANIPKAYNAQKHDKAWIQNLCKEKEKRVALQLYVQDILGGENKTVYEVARASITSGSPSMFGRVFVLDDLITADPDKNSEKLGRLQGLINFSDFRVTTLHMHLVFYLTTGEYKGSTIIVLGRNEFYDEINRELAVVGGTGIFREARGYAITNTISYDHVVNYYVLEYKLYVRYNTDCDTLPEVDEQTLHATP